MSDTKSESNVDEKKAGDASEKDKQSDAGSSAASDAGNQKQQDDDKPKLKDALRKPAKLKPGDYVVQVHMIEARDLKGRGIGDMSDPVGVVECMKQKATTRVHKANLNPVFDQVLVMEYKKLEPAEVEAGRVKISIFDANTVRRNVLIGAFEFDLGGIYYREHHEMFRQWVALTDVTDAHEGVQGYLKLSIVVLGPDDEQHIHSAEEEDDEAEDGMMTVIMPPVIEQKGMLLQIRVYDCADLPEMDEGFFGGKCDPYAQVEFAGVKGKTSRKKGQNVTILEELQIPVMEPIMSDAVRFSMYDWDQAGSNDRIQTISLSYSEIKAGNLLAPKWFNLYGAPVGKQRGLAGKMNKGYIEGTFFRGRVLVAAEVKEEPEPKLDSVSCAGLDPTRRPVMERYVIQLDLYEGSEIPDKGDMHVEVSCGNNYFPSTAVDVSEGRCRWYEEIKHNGGDLIVTFPRDLTQVPDVFVYLCAGTKRISYIRLPFEELVIAGWSTPPSWHILREDVSIDALDGQKAEFPGILLFSCRVGPASTVPPKPFPESRPMSNIHIRSDTRESLAHAEDEDDDEHKGLLAGEQKQPQDTAEPIATVGDLTLEVIEGRNLPIMDKNSSDPYVKVSIGDREFKTKVIKKNVNPQWNEKFVWQKILISSTLHVAVYDHDRFSKDEVMGTTTIDLRSQQTASTSDPGHDFVYESWVLVSDKFPNAAVRMRFTFKYLPLAQSLAAEQHLLLAQKKEKEKAAKGGFLKRSKSVFKKKKKLPTEKTALGEPEEAQFQLRVHIYQARGIPATDARGTSDPYIIVRLCGKKIKTEIRKQTVNPVWYHSFAMNVELPTPLTLAPDIQLVVFDWDKFSKDDPIGRFSVSPIEAFEMNPSINDLRPRWFQLRDWQDDVIQGAEVLCSFQLLEALDAGAAMPDIRPPTRDMFLELTTLGLRGVTSTLGVHKLFMQFNMPNGRIYKTNQSRIPTPNSPNFLQVLKIPIAVPVDSLFAPSIDIEVRDVILGGFIKRLIGAASLQLGEFMDRRDPQVEVMDEMEAHANMLEVTDETRSRRQGDDETKDGRGGRERKPLRIDPSRRSPNPEESTPKKPTMIDNLVRADEKEDSNFSDQPLLSARSAKTNDDTGAGIGGLDVESQTDSDDDEKTQLNPAKDKQAEKKQEQFGDRDDDTMDIDTLSKDASADTGDIPEYMKGRKTVDNELEDELKMEPFDRIGLFTGQQNAGRFGKKYSQVGAFKGLVRLIASKDEPGGVDTKDLLQPKELFLRIYILTATKLMPKDDDGTCDPYLKIKVGKQKISTRDRKIRNTLEPEFYESFEIPVTIPGDAEVEISVWDWDGIGDDLVGSTKIDIEDRWFCKPWRGLAKKPLEIRTLHCPTSTASQGKLSMWLEILEPGDAKKTPMVNITPPPPEPFELRVIVWATRDITIKDTITQQNDLYVTGALSVDGIKPQKTDVHFRSKKGKGNFNWRMKFPLLLPVKRGMTWPRIRFQVWDKDYFSANDSICETVISLKGLCKQALKKKDSVAVTVKGKDKFWIEDLRHPNEEGSQGRLQVSLELMPEAVAKQIPAGFGRSDPNQNPHLPEPEGRFHFSLFSPLRMLRDILGDGLYYKLCGGFCCILIVAACVFTAPMIFSNIVSNVIL